MQRKKLLLMLLALAAMIIIAMLAILLLADYSHGNAPPGIETRIPSGVEAMSETPLPDEATALPQITLPLVGPTVSPTISPGDALPTEENTPQNAVKRYLDRWNAKDAEGMDACLIKSQRAQRDHEFENIDSIEVLRIATLSAAETEAGFPEGVGEDAYAKALISADYTVRYSEVGKSFFMVDSATREEYKFWLVKEAEDGPWLIALQGY